MIFISVDDTTSQWLSKTPAQHIPRPLTSTAIKRRRGEPEPELESMSEQGIEGSEASSERDFDM